MLISLLLEIDCSVVFASGNEVVVDAYDALFIGVSSVSLTSTKRVPNGRPSGL